MYAVHTDKEYIHAHLIWKRVELQGIADEKYDEALAIEMYVAERKSVDKTEVFCFSIDDSGGDLKLYMQIMKKLGVRMGQEKMFEDYQKVYEETMKRQDEYNMKKEKMWEYDRAR